MPDSVDGSRMVPSGPEQHAEISPLPGATPADQLPAPLAAWLNRLGLGGVADFLLDVGRPFGWIGAQLVLVAQPTLALFGKGEASSRLAAWLEGLQETESHKP